METIKFKMEVQSCNENGVPVSNPWIEEYEYPLDQIVAGFARDMVTHFNDTRHEGESIRRLNNVEIIK